MNYLLQSWQRIAWLACLLGAASMAAADENTVDSAVARRPRVAAVVTEWRANSHAEVLPGRILESDSLDGQGKFPQLQLVSIFTDQVSERDSSRAAAEKHGVQICDSIEQALTLGTGKLAVDGVIMIAEHGKYPRSETGQTIYPKRRMFGEIAKVFESSGRVVPVFSDKHLADNWTDAKWFYDTAVRLKIPLMAGSSLPTTWRHPATDVKAGTKLKELVAINYGSLDAYGFHALEMVQSLVERRAGGETGVAAVECLTGAAVWEAGRSGRYDRKLLDRALAMQESRLAHKNKPVEELVREPVVLLIEYKDGLKASVFTLNGAVADWCAAWRYADDDSVDAVLFAVEEDRPYGHFAFQLQGIEKMMLTGKPTWNVERTLLTSGLLDAMHVSKHKEGVRLETPELTFSYEMLWQWEPPPEAQASKKDSP